MNKDNYEDFFNALKIREEQFFIARDRYMELLDELERMLLKKRGAINLDDHNKNKNLLIEYSAEKKDNDEESKEKTVRIKNLSEDIDSILKENRKILTVTQITERLIERGRMFAAANPEASVNTCLHKGVLSGKFKKFSKGKFGLNEWCS